jgi:hypothetical protein
MLKSMSPILEEVPNECIDESGEDATDYTF